MRIFGDKNPPTNLIFMLIKEILYKHINCIYVSQVKKPHTNRCTTYTKKGKPQITR